MYNDIIIIKVSELTFATHKNEIVLRKKKVLYAVSLPNFVLHSKRAIQ